jgi:hypothetical protein
VAAFVVASRRLGVGPGVTFAKRNSHILTWRKIDFVSVELGAHCALLAAGVEIQWKAKLCEGVSICQDKPDKNEDAR